MATGLWQFCEHTKGTVRQIDSKLDEIHALIGRHDSAIQPQVDNISGIGADIRTFEGGVRDSVSETKTAIETVHANVESLAAGVRAGGGGPPGIGGGFERDRPIFDLHDYKVEPLPAQISLSACKKWRHDTEIYLDTIGPSRPGVKQMLPQTRHSTDPLARNRTS